MVVGNPLILGLDPLWRKFLSYVHRNGGWKGLEPTWNTNEHEDNSGDEEGGGANVIPQAAGGLTEMDALMQRLHDMVVADGEDKSDDGEEDFEVARREANEDRGPWREEE